MIKGYISFFCLPCFASEQMGNHYRIYFRNVCGFGMAASDMISQRLGVEIYHLFEKYLNDAPSNAWLYLSAGLFVVVYPFPVIMKWKMYLLLIIPEFKCCFGLTGSRRRKKSFFIYENEMKTLHVLHNSCFGLQRRNGKATVIIKNSWNLNLCIMDYLFTSYRLECV